MHKKSLKEYLMKNMYKLFTLQAALSVLISACCGSANSETTSGSGAPTNGKVPGPSYRVRVGDTIEVHLKNLNIWSSTAQRMA
jgi:FtsP/CotA-like multicopper oxidase with cupredoxin domain